MAYGIDLPVTHDSECTSYYAVSIKKDTDNVFTNLSNQFTSPITIQGLDNLTNYTVRIQRYCCNGQSSNIASYSFSTGT